MRYSNLILPRGSAVKKNQWRIIAAIALCWTVIDFILFLLRMARTGVPLKYGDDGENSTQAILLRELNVFLVSLIMGYFLIIVLRNFLRNSSFIVNLIVKTLVLVGVALVMNLFIQLTYDMGLQKETFEESFNSFIHRTFSGPWLLKRMPEWIMLFVVTLLAIEINAKYTPGVFIDTVLGKYLQPREEDRIIMFIDLKDSTPIAEKLGHQEYFKFIRDVIFCISAGIMEHDGRVYQYVGDEIVVWWPTNQKNARKAVDSIIAARKLINKNMQFFKNRYANTLPEFKVGIHAGTVMVGQVGISKKELVMSGDTINTAARIRSASSEMNQKFVVSRDIVELLQMEEWQSENLGHVELKGKNESVELYALKI